MSTLVPSARLQSAAEALLTQSLLAGQAPIPHAAGDDARVAFMEEIALLHGYTADRYPALFSSFHDKATPQVRLDGPSNTGDFVDGQLIDYLAPLAANGMASAHAIVTRTRPVASTYVAISVMNVNGSTKTVLASGSSLSYLQQTCEVQTNDTNALALPSTGQNFATMAWSIEYSDGTSESNFVSSQWAFNTSADPDVSDPAISTRTHGDLGNVMIGLSRGFNSPANNTDIDYWFWQTQFQNTTLLVPFQGAMHFNRPIAPLSSANPQLFFYLARAEGGMSELVAAKTQPYMSGFWIDDKDPCKLNFKLMANPNDPGNAINFGFSPWVADTRTFFTGKVVVTLNDNTPAWSSVLSSTSPDLNSTDGVKYIKPIVYVWHCLAAGTQIQMADGSTQVIEAMEAGMTVQSAGGAQSVQATLAQPHWGTVFVIQTQGGLSITCSGTHPMLTPGGAVQASVLAPGSVVLTRNGNDTVSAITQQQQNGEGLFNLWLDGASGTSSFYANGFLVGDYQMQVALQQQPDPASVQARLPVHLHADYASHLQDQATRQARLTT